MYYANLINKRLQLYDRWTEFFDQPVKSNTRIYNNIIKITTSQGDDQTTGCLLFYPYLNECYKMITVDLSKQQALDAEQKAIQQINFTGNLEQAGNTTMFFIRLVNLMIRLILYTNYCELTHKF